MKASTVVYLFIAFSRARAFLVAPRSGRPSVALRLAPDDFYGGNLVSGGIHDQETHRLYHDLFARQCSLKAGIGKRYICRTKNGTLKVHQEFGDPFNTENVVAHLTDGQVVTTLGPPRGEWIYHDHGGWSLAEYDGFTLMEELEE